MKFGNMGSGIWGDVYWKKGSTNDRIYPRKSMNKILIFGFRNLGDVFLHLPWCQASFFRQKIKYFYLHDVAICLHRVDKKKGQKYRSVNDTCRKFHFSQFFQKSFGILKFNTRFFVLIFDFWKIELKKLWKCVLDHNAHNSKKIILKVLAYFFKLF